MDASPDQTPAVPPVGNVAPGGRGRSINISARSIAIVGLVLATFAFFGVRAALNRQAPTAEELAAAFTPLATFQYETMPDEAMAPLRAAFATQNENGVASFEARQITQDGAPVAVVFILSVDPDELSEDFEDDYAIGFQETSQASVEDLRVGDTAGHVAATPLGTVVFFFDEDGFVFNVVGPDNRSVESIARALEIANS